MLMHKILEHPELIKKYIVMDKIINVTVNDMGMKHSLHIGTCIRRMR